MNNIQSANETVPTKPGENGSTNSEHVNIESTTCDKKEKSKTTISALMCTLFYNPVVLNNSENTTNGGLICSKGKLDILPCTLRQHNGPLKASSCYRCRKLVSNTEELKLFTKSRLVTYLQSVNNSDPISLSSMVLLRKLFSDPIDTKFCVKLSQHDFEDLLQIGVEADVPEIISQIILQYEKADIIDNKIASYLIDAFWILTNISSGTKSQTMSVIKAGIVPFTKHIIDTCGNMQLVTQCIMLVSNVMVDDQDILDNVLNGSTYKTLRSIFSSVDFECQAQIVNLYFSLVKAKYRSLDLLKTNSMLNQAISVMNLNAPVTLLRSIMDLFNERSHQYHSNDDVIESFIDFGYVPKLSAFLCHTDSKVRNSCLMTIGNLLLGDDKTTLKIIKCGSLEHVIDLLLSEDIETVKHCLWILSNVAAGTSYMIDYFFDFNIMPTILSCVMCDEPKIAIEALWTLNNIVKGSSDEQLQKHIYLNKDILTTVRDIFAAYPTNLQSFASRKDQYLGLAQDTLADIMEKTIGPQSQLHNGFKERVHVLYRETNLESVLKEKSMETFDNDNNGISDAFTNLYDMFSEDVDEAP